MQTEIILHGHHQSQQPNAVSASGIYTFPEVCCQWTASLDRHGIDWREDDKARKDRCFLFSATSGTAFLCKPCAAALQLYDCVDIEKEVKWFQILVEPVLLEQWGVEAPEDTWCQGMICHNAYTLSCLALLALRPPALPVPPEAEAKLPPVAAKWLVLD